MNPDNISLRDHFAELAMLELLNNELKTENKVFALQLAKAAYVIADAMLAEREKGNKQV